MGNVLTSGTGSKQSKAHRSACYVSPAASLPFLFSHVRITSKCFYGGKIDFRTLIGLHVFSASGYGIVVFRIQAP
jgi:hypothetical protein